MKLFVKDGNPVDPNFIILDDMIGLMSHHTKFFVNWISTSRHTNTSVFIAAQSISRGVGTVLQKNAHLCFMFRTIHNDELTMMWKAWGQLMGKKDLFIKTFHKVTIPKHSALLFLADDNRSAKHAYKLFCATQAPDFHYSLFSPPAPEETIQEHSIFEEESIDSTEVMTDDSNSTGSGEGEPLFVTD